MGGVAGSQAARMEGRRENKGQLPEQKMTQVLHPSSVSSFPSLATSLMSLGTKTNLVKKKSGRWKRKSPVSIHRKCL